MTNPLTETNNPKCQKLVDKLISSGLKTRDFFQSIDQDDWYQQVYTEGANWSVQQILAHFVSSEASITRLIKIILDGNPGVPVNFDLNAYNEREINCLAKLPYDMILQRFMERRGETIQMIMELSDPDLEKEGRHPWLGIAPIEDMIKLMYRHNKIHQRDIRRILTS